MFIFAKEKHLYKTSVIPGQATPKLHQTQPESKKQLKKARIKAARPEYYHKT